MCTSGAIYGDLRAVVCLVILILLDVDRFDLQLFVFGFGEGGRPILVQTGFRNCPREGCHRRPTVVQIIGREVASWWSIGFESCSDFLQEYTTLTHQRRPCKRFSRRGPFRESFRAY